MFGAANIQVTWEKTLQTSIMVTTISFDMSRVHNSQSWRAVEADKFVADT